MLVPSRPGVALGARTSPSAGGPGRCAAQAAQPGGAAGAVVWIGSHQGCHLRSGLFLVRVLTCSFLSFRPSWSGFGETLGRITPARGHAEGPRTIWHGGFGPCRATRFPSKAPGWLGPVFVLCAVSYVVAAPPFRRARWGSLVGVGDRCRAGRSPGRGDRDLVLAVPG